MPKINIQVFPLVKEWKFTIDETGASGQRVYMDAAAYPGEATVELPSIGDSWDGNYANCRVNKIDVQYFDDNDICPQKFTCYYQTIFIDTQAMENDGEPRPSEDDLVIAMETSGELISIDPTSGDTTLGYKWEDDDEPVTQPLFKTVSTTTLKVQRMIVGTSGLTDLLNATWDCVGKVNNAPWFGTDSGTLLYTGFTSTPWVSETDTKKWKCELTFVIRTVTDVPGFDGWNYVLRETRKAGTDPWWQRPYRQVSGMAAQIYLYDNADFGPLFSAGEEGDDPIDARNVPKQ